MIKSSLNVENGFILGCDRECISKYSAKEKTWLCGDQCLSWSTPCKRKCLFDLKFNCAEEVCEEEKTSTSYLCNNECVTEETPCQGTCPHHKVLCNGKCQEKTLQCNGECLDTYYDFANCDGTCTYYDHKNWLCNSDCQPKEEPCNGKCPEGKLRLGKDRLG